MTYPDAETDARIYPQADTMPATPFDGLMQLTSELANRVDQLVSDNARLRMEKTKLMAEMDQQIATTNEKMSGMIARILEADQRSNEVAYNTRSKF